MCLSHAAAVLLVGLNEALAQERAVLRTFRFVMLSSPLMVASWSWDLQHNCFSAVRCKSAVSAAAALVSTLAAGTFDDGNFAFDAGDLTQGHK